MHWHKDDRDHRMARRARRMLEIMEMAMDGGEEGPRGPGRGHRGHGRHARRGGNGPWGEGPGGRSGHGPAGDFPRGRGRGRPGRALEPGDLRWLALDLIAQQPRHGYEIIKAVEDALDGHYAPSPGAVYPMLTLLEETGLIAAEVQGAKKLYSLTYAGRAEVESHADAIAAAQDRLNRAARRFGGAPAPEMLRAMANLRAALQVRLARGPLSAEELAKVTEAIDRAASEIERA